MICARTLIGNGSRYLNWDCPEFAYKVNGKIPVEMNLKLNKW